jgi:hypothetical protein
MPASGRSTPHPLSTVEERILSAGLSFAVIAAVGQTAVHLVNAAFFDKPQFNVNLEHNVFAWAGTVSSFAVAFVALVTAVAVPAYRARFGLLAAITGFFSLDDMVQIHERLGTDTAESLGLPNWFDSLLWPALYLPLLAGALALLLSFARAAPQRPRRFVEVALVLLVFAVAAEAVSAGWTGSPTAWPHVLEGAVEEAAELAAWILIAAALTAIAGREVAGVSRS